jgi:hypothetical protein
MRYFLAGFAACIFLCLSAELGYRAAESLGLLGDDPDLRITYRQPKNDPASSGFAEYIRRLDDPFEAVRKSDLGPQELETTFTPLGKFKKRSRTLLRPSGQALCDVTYEVDQQGRRAVPSSPANATDSLFVIGASPVFGTCLEARHTVPAYLQQMFPTTRVHNLGMEGIGPNDALAVLEEKLPPWDQPRVFDRLEPGRGTVVFYFNPAPGFERMRCSIRCYQNGYVSNKPYYTLKNGELRFAGKLKDAQMPLLAPLVRLLGESHLLKAYAVDVPPLMERDSRLLGAIMKQIRLRLEQKISANRYLFVVDSYRQTGLLQQLEPFIEDAGWEFISLDATAKLKSYCSNCAKIPYDHHPTPQFNWIFARLLAEKIKGGR